MRDVSVTLFLIAALSVASIPIGRADAFTEKYRFADDEETTRLNQHELERITGISPSITHIQKTAICSYSPIPNGWIKVDDQWSSTTCGNPPNITYNITIIQRYDIMPVGSVMDFCTGAPVPSGWVVINSRWLPTSCGHPSNITNNVSTMRRIQ